MAFLLALLTLFVQLLPASAVASAQAQGITRQRLREYEIVNGYYFSQTGGSRDAEHGYSITDEDGVLLWSEFQRLGGVDVLGYPVTQRFFWDGFVVQATQKVVLQWRPEARRAIFVNLLDELTRAGKDDWLLTYRQIPKPVAFEGEASLPFGQVVQNRLKLLEAHPALRTAYLAAPDPLEANGLPVAPVTDMGPAYVLRTQRKAFQLWKEATPFAARGDVTVVNGGDLGKEGEIYPSAVTRPEPASAHIAAPPGSNTRLSKDELAALRQVVERVRPAVIKLTDGDQGSGSGIIFDPSGLILTNSHVITSLRLDKLRADLPDGRSLPVTPVGADDWTDVAVVKVDATNLPSAPLGSSQSLTIGQRVIAIGYAPVLPAAPSAKTGIIHSLTGEIQTLHDYPLSNLVATNTFLHPGDSGGPLLNLSGQVIGVNSAIRVSRRGQELAGFSIPVEGARQIAEQFIAVGKVPRPHIGVGQVDDVTPATASNRGLPVARGVLIGQVQPGSPAAAAGLNAGDVIAGMDNREVANLDDLRRLMVNHKVGDAVPFAIISPGRPRRTVVITLSERPPLV